MHHQAAAMESVATTPLSHPHSPSGTLRKTAKGKHVSFTADALPPPFEGYTVLIDQDPRPYFLSPFLSRSERNTPLHLGLSEVRRPGSIAKHPLRLVELEEDGLIDAEWSETHRQITSTLRMRILRDILVSLYCNVV